MNKKERGNKRDKGFVLELMALIFIPLVIFSIIITIVSIKELEHRVEAEKKEALRNASVSLLAAYNQMYPGDFALDSDGKLQKGGQIVEAEHSLIDEIKNNTAMDIALFYGNQSVLTSFADENQTIEIEALDAASSKVIQQGKEYFDHKVKVGAVEYYSFYLPVANEDGTVVGMLFAGEQRDTAIGAGSWRIIITSLILLGLTISLGLIMPIHFSGAMQKVTKSLKAIATGNLNVEIDKKILKRGDEIGAIARAGETLQESLNGIIHNITSNVEVLAAASHGLNHMTEETYKTISEVGRAIDEISSGAMMQAEETQTASLSVMDMGELISEIVVNAEDLNTHAERMDRSEKEADSIINELNETNNKTTQVVERIAAQTDITNNSAQQIKQAVDIITSIAEETNLLSLNASIEAARAGEQGKGFAVVANEIQKLAEQSNESARSIGETIDELLRDSEKTVEIMQEVQEIVHEQEEKLEETKEKFVDLTDGIENSMEGIHIIKANTDKLSVIRERIVLMVESLSSISQENAASTEETSAATEELQATISELAHSAQTLDNIAEELKENVEVFQM